MLDHLRNNALVNKAAKEWEQMFIWGVEGQLGEGRWEGRTPCGWCDILCLLTEISVRYGCHHVQGVVKVQRASSQRREGRQSRGARHIVAGEGKGASQSLSRHRWRRAIGEKSHLVSERIWGAEWEGFPWDLNSNNVERVSLTQSFQKYCDRDKRHEKCVILKKHPKTNRVYGSKWVLSVQRCGGAHESWTAWTSNRVKYVITVNLGMSPSSVETVISLKDSVNPEKSIKRNPDMGFWILLINIGRKQFMSFYPQIQARTLSCIYSNIMPNHSLHLFVSAWLRFKSPKGAKLAALQFTTFFFLCSAYVLYLS